MSDKIRILYIDNTYTFGGAINSLCHLIKAMDKERFIPVLVTGQPKKFLATHFRDIHWVYYQPKLTWVNNHIYKKIAKICFFKLCFFKTILNLFRFIYWLLFISIPEAFRYYKIGKKYKVTLVHLNNILGSQLSGIIAAKLLRVPCVAHLRDFEDIHPVTKFYARLIDHHIAISSAIKENLQQLGVPNNKISIVYDALDLNEFNTDVDCSYLDKEFPQYSSCLRYALFGRIVDWKGIREFLLAAKIINCEIPNAIGFIVGGSSDGDEAYEHEMKRFVKTLQINDKIVFTGYRKDVPALMKYMDVIVHASNCPEPFGMVLIEGMAMGKPVVATRAGGPIDIVDDGNNGYLVKIGDVNELAKAIVTLLKNRELCNQMGKKGKDIVTRIFNNRLCKDDIQNIYIKVSN